MNWTEKIGQGPISNAPSRCRVLIISHDVVSKNLAGPGVRYLNFGRVLAKDCDVELAIPAESAGEFQPTEFPIFRYRRSNWTDIKARANNADVVVCSSHSADEFPQLGDIPGTVVIDGYDPLLLEWLAMNADADLAIQSATWANYMRTLITQYRIGDLYLCASEQQRLWWIGMLEAHGRLNPEIYRQDATLRTFVATVPFGLPDLGRPAASPNVIKGIWNGISSEDRIVLWGGGLWRWLDPLTAIRAMAHVVEHRPDVRLVFPGTNRPGRSPTLAIEAQALADQLGLLNRAVFFGDWIPYADWPGVLRESDVALSLGNDIPETQLAYRARILDYVAAEVPMIITGGDATSEIVQQHNLGTIVPFNDDRAVAGAILKLLDVPRETFGARFAAARQGLAWEDVTQPLLQFCRNPRHAPDRLANPDRIGHPVFLGWRDEARASLAELDKMRAILADLRPSRDALQLRLTQSEAECARLEATLNNTSLALTRSQAETERASETLEDTRRSIDAAQHQLEEKEEELNTLYASQAGLARQNNELRAGLKSAEALVTSYERGRFMRLMKWVKTGRK